MSVSLSEDDWDRILFALSHFSHNLEFKETLERVRQQLGQDRE